MQNIHFSYTSRLWICVILVLTGISGCTKADHPLKSLTARLEETNQTKPSTEYMFQKFIKTVFPVELSEKPDVIFLFPVSGCQYCAKKTIQFAKELSNDKVKVSSIISSNEMAEVNSQPHFSELNPVLYDLGRKALSFGFGEGFPSFAVFKNAECKRAGNFDAEKIDSQFEEIRSFLGINQTQQAGVAIQPASLVNQ